MSLGLFDRAGVRGAAPVDARIRPRGDLSGRADRGGDRQRRPRADLRVAAPQRQGAWAVGGSPASGAGRSGLRPGEARTDERGARRLHLRAVRLRLPGARLRQQRDPRARRHAGAEGALAASAAERRAALRVLDDRARDAGLGPDAAPVARRPGRRGLHPQRPQVVHLERVDFGLPDRHGRDGSRSSAARTRARCSSCRRARPA